MTEVEVVQFAATCECLACKAITEHEYYVWKPTPIGEVTTSKNKFDGRKCRVCQQKIRVGMMCHSAPKQGAWHLNCSPKNEGE
jgi:hypothetical protein